MIGQFDGHVPGAASDTSAPECAPERDGPLATRVNNGATPSVGIPRPGLAQQLHESLNNPNALPGYSVGPVIGEGGFCKVRLGTHLVSGEKVAIKVIDKTRLTDPTDRKRVAREIKVLKKLNQQSNIIRLLEVGEASSRIHVIMEHASGGTLLDHVRKKKRLPEPEARDCLRQILVGLTYCHAQGVIHRDIKLENLLLTADRQMKIIDFGLSAILVPGKKLRVHCGSPSYAAPEIVSRQLYDGPPVDVWSLGVVLFAMITGYLPFHASGSNKDELCQKIIAGVYKTPDWISDESKDLLRGMLTTDPRRRLTLEQVADHPWVRGKSVPCWRLPGLPTELECRPPLDPAILNCISKRIDTQSLSESILRGEHTYFTATYHLLATRAQSDRRRAYGEPDRPPLVAS
ncbi:hypothetical protein KFL_000340110 [Klebsormidium nitens]|uniref:Protein kinase domain-containing protein n=1 Tax=Klebsormidium nitens TaxID=105231 RepID=A0A1Y1HUS8_KLENI|nr:hypothetical protein KFL_000340110 [Klebsormidium nitens]|eukprot:GAQ79608.1 hypothetical protein KFL_000340110 [Klebsormidium nitens]